MSQLPFLRPSRYLRASPITGLVLAAIALIICLIYSVTLGAREIALEDILKSFTDFDRSFDHLIIQTVRLPRSLMAIAVGAALSVSGALMQGLTRNPLAETGILGISSGGALAVVGTLFVFGNSSLTGYAIAAFVGAAIAAFVVYGLALLGSGGATPLNLTIAGAAVTALISSITTGILIVSQQTLEEIRFWLAGSLSGRDFELFLYLLPFMVVGLILALLLGKQITTMSLGEEIATSLGQQTLAIKLLTAASVVLLAGSSVAIAGPISFIGLVVPHGVRFFIKTDYRWILPYSAIFGSLLLLLSDIAARVLLKPQELPVGVMTALMGAPVFVYLAKSKVRK
ncbi:iron ABC transporter permease [Pseudanabaena sp. SR411]|uniref:FecCD family ABC transporter permease n=1 Tax=Pseudanabaena sp. SR411 TaxID=1980935 RepID=UPI000B9910B4|nr:iron ABC transporter permease [Pseudanabaena sp. SR411]OYQ66034.1 iron ABC transporter permease [Pseudanabaena sp. SR411]